MALDPNISLSYKAPQFENPMNMLSQAMQVQGLQNQNALAQYSLSKAQRSDEDMNALMRHLQTGGDLSTPEGQAAAFKVAPLSAPGLIKSQLEQGKLVAETKKNTADANKFDMEAAQKRMDVIGQTFGQLRNNPSLEGANAAIDMLQQQKILTPELAAQHKQAIAADPSKIPQMANTYFSAALSVKDQLPEYQTRNTGGTTQTLAINRATGAVNVASSVANTQSPDSIATNATSRANNAATIAGENMRAGVTPGGGMDDNSERTAQAIANGQLPAPTGMALLNPKNQRILGRVMEINPQYDATTVSAKKAAATAFTSGTQGNALRSVSTANAHLDQLGELADALQNGDTQVINKVQNYFSKATGNPAVTNFDAIKAIVGQEVVKAIVAGGGGVQEREEAAKIFSSASSPQQLKGAIQHYRMVMGAQANNLMEQRRAAGLPDSTLPDYTKTNGGGNPVTSAIDAELARRGGK